VDPGHRLDRAHERGWLLSLRPRLPPRDRAHGPGAPGRATHPPTAEAVTKPPGRELYAWGLFSRNYWLDDEMGELVTILDLLAPHIEEPGYGGYFREEYDAEPTVFTFRNGTYGPLKL
jgi:hypothetical protein